MTNHKIFPLKLNVIYEDDYLAIIYKPAGIVVSANNYRNIRNALSYNLTASSQVDALDIPLPAHRLDMATQGLLLVGKTKSAIHLLHKLFENRQILKTYHALVQGKMTKKGVIETNIESKSAITHFIIKESYKSISYEELHLVALRPFTGRKHQIRIHLHAIGHNVLGDPLYFGAHKRLFKKGLFLAATGLSFTHPISNKAIVINIPIPSKFRNILANENKRWHKFNS